MKSFLILYRDGTWKNFRMFKGFTYFRNIIYIFIFVFKHFIYNEIILNLRFTTIIGRQNSLNNFYVKNQKKIWRTLITKMVLIYLPQFWHFLLFFFIKNRVPICIICLFGQNKLYLFIFQNLLKKVAIL